MSEYVVIFHTWNDGTWGAFVPDLPDVFAVGDTFADVAAAVEEGLADYERKLRAEGRALPPARHVAGTVSTATAGVEHVADETARLYATR